MTLLIQTINDYKIHD